MSKKTNASKNKAHKAKPYGKTAKKTSIKMNPPNQKLKQGDVVMCSYETDVPFETVIVKVIDEILEVFSSDQQKYIVEHPKGMPIVSIGMGGIGYRPVKYDRYYYVYASQVKAFAPAKEKGIDLTKLDAVILDEASKSEIEAVLKQHKHGKKIFEEWGLGESIEYGKGMTFLFYGPPGTGKTWCANCMAKAIGTEIISIGGAEIFSSEPGGANRNIQNAFSAAKSGKKVLFIDECDSLVSSRDGMGMIVSSEINTLLTEIEKFEGVLILATNRIENLDEALERRISLIVEFPEPNYESRLKIIEKLIPSKMPLDKDVDKKELATYKLTGGQIKNMILNAARLALSEEADKVSKRHFVSAINRIKSSKSLMGTASRWRADLVRDMSGDIVKSRKGAVKKDIENINE